MSNDSIPVAVGEPARVMIRAWAESHGMTLYQGREGEKYPVVEWRGMHAGEYKPWDGTGPAIAQIGRYMAILDADDEQARELVASWNLPEHFATRGVSYTKQVVTEHHYFSCFEGLKRILGMCPGLDLLANPDDAEMWIKVYDEAYEVLSVQSGRPVPALPDHVVSLHRAEAEERSQRSAADGDVPVGRYRAEGIEHGYQSHELYRSACSLAGRRIQPDEILSVLAEIVEHSQTDAWDPWREGQLASMADRAYRRYGKLPLVVQELETWDPDPALYPADPDQGQDQEPEPGQEPKPEQGPEQESLGRHAAVPRLRVASPDELAEWADGVVQAVLAPLREVADAARPADPQAEDPQWTGMGRLLSFTQVGAEVLGRLGDLDLIDFGAAKAILRPVVLPADYTAKMNDKVQDDLYRQFTELCIAGWNKGAVEGCEVPAELQAALDAWHPPCPLDREGIEAHRLPAREGRWPVQNHVSKADDRGNARRLIDHYGDLIRFDDVDLKPLAHNGQRWLDSDSTGQGLANEFADKTIGALPVTEAMSLSVEIQYIDKDGNPVSDRDRFWTWLNAQQSNAKRTSMVSCASTMEDIRISATRLDADARWLNTPSGEIDLGLSEIDPDGKWRCAEPVVHHLGQHYPEHLHTRITKAGYDPMATCPEWEQALKSWLDYDDVIVFIGKLVAASIRGMTTLKMIPVLLGHGNSGKSTFLEVIMDVLDSYATTAAPSILRKGKGGTLTDDLADLRGLRFVSSTETSGAEEMDEPRIKRLSGGDRVRARGMYQSSAEWDPLFLLWFATNAMPRLSGEDLALWGRFPPVEFPHMFTESGLAPDGEPCEVADPHLKQRLRAEGPGILNWIIRHLELLYDEGLAEPRAVTDKRWELQAQADTSGQFIAEMKQASAEADSGEQSSYADQTLAAHPDLRIRFTSLLHHYKAWAKQHEINAVGSKPFRASLTNHGYKVTKPHNVETVTGIGHRPGAMGQCHVCQEMVKEPKPPKGLIR